MKNWHIIWDYDGTILPFMPYDSEQFLLDSLVKSNRHKIPFHKKAVSRAAIFADNRQLLGHSFKKYYNWILKGIDASILEGVNTSLAAFIPDSHIDTLSKLSMKQYSMSIISCGTGDLCVAPLRHKKADSFFSRIVSNFFTYRNNRISGMDFHVLKGEDKVRHAKDMGHNPERTIVVGDGYTDIPLLDWCSCPVLIDPEGKKRKKFAGKNYHFIESLSELPHILEKHRYY